MAYATVTLTGTYQTPDGTPHKGHVEIIPSERVIKDTTGDIILTGRVKVDLDAQGAFTVALPATDDPTLNPTGFGYTIAAKLHSSHPPAVSFSLPASLGATTVEDLTPVDPATFAPTTTYAETSDLDALAATIPTTAADVNALPDTTVIPTTPTDLGAAKAIPETLTAYETQADHIKRVMYQTTDALYAVAQSGVFTVYKSTDFGATWTAKGALPALPCALMRVETTGTLLAVEDTTRTLAGQTPSVWRSTDDGATWTEVTTLNFPTLSTSGMVETPSGHIVVAEYGNVANTAYRLMRSADDGQTWAQVKASSGTDPGGDPGHWHSVTYDPMEGCLVAFSDRPIVSGVSGPEIYRSDDEGATWTLVGMSSEAHYPNFVAPMYFADYIAWGSDNQRNGVISRLKRADFYAGRFDQVQDVATVSRKALYYPFPLRDGVWAISSATEVIAAEQEPLGPGSYGHQVYVVSDNGASVTGGVEFVVEHTQVGQIAGLKASWPGYAHDATDHDGRAWINAPSLTTRYGSTAMPVTVGTDPVMRRSARFAPFGGFRKFIPGYWYGVPGPYSPTTAGASNGVQFACPIWIPSTTRLDRIAAEITGTSTGTVRLGVYDSGAYDSPNLLLLDAGTIDATTVGIKELAIDLTLPPGLYWLSVVAQGGGPGMRSIGSTTQPPVGAPTFQGASASTGMNAYYRTGQTGALTNWSGLSATPNCPKIMVRASA